MEEPFKIVEAKGMSMWPTLLPGDHLVIKPKSTYKLGEVVAVKMREKWIVHRIVLIENNKFYLKGDNQSKQDGGFSKPEVIGKVVAVRRPGKNEVLGAHKYLRQMSFLGFYFPWLIPSIYRIVKKLSLLKK